MEYFTKYIVAARPPQCVSHFWAVPFLSGGCSLERHLTCSGNQSGVVPVCWVGTCRCMYIGRLGNSMALQGCEAHPLCSGAAVVQSCRVGILWRQPILHRCHQSLTAKHATIGALISLSSIFYLPTSKKTDMVSVPKIQIGTSSSLFFK